METGQMICDFQGGYFSTYVHRDILYLYLGEETIITLTKIMDRQKNCSLYKSVDIDKLFRGETIWGSILL